MLPKTKMGRAMGSKLKVYRGDKHPHEAQQPVALEDCDITVLAGLKQAAERVKREWQIWFSITGRAGASRRLPASFCVPARASGRLTARRFEEYFVTEQQRVCGQADAGRGRAGRQLRRCHHGASGGVAAQADAVKMGVARALIEFNPELRKTLKAEGLLTRDARVKERKKYGQKGARKRFQFSKR